MEKSNKKFPSQSSSVFTGIPGKLHIKNSISKSLYAFVRSCSDLTYAGSALILEQHLFMWVQNYGWNRLVSFECATCEGTFVIAVPNNEHKWSINFLSNEWVWLPLCAPDVKINWIFKRYWVLYWDGEAVYWFFENGYL